MIIALVSFSIYANSIGNKYVLYDSSVITEHCVEKLGRGLLGTILKTSYRYGYWNKPGSVYRPLSLLMFAIEWEIAPDEPLLGHLINVLFYMLTGLLLFITLARIMKDYNIIIPFIISLLFIAHPVHTEVVANIKSRDEIMSFFFVILALNLLWTYITRNKKLPLILSLACYFLAFLSKEGVITILAVIPLLIWYFSDTKPSKNIITSALFLIPAFAYLLLRKKVIGQIEPGEVSVIDNLLVAAHNGGEKTATAIKIMGIYLVKLIWPHPLCADYSYNQIPVTGFGNISVILSFMAYLGMGVFAIWKIKKKNLLVFGILFYLITMSLYSNIVILIGSSFGERFLYFSSLGFAIAVTYFLMKLFKKDLSYKGFKVLNEFFGPNKGILLVTLIIVFIYGVKSAYRNSEWKSNNTLYTADVQKSPNSAHMRYYYGLTLMKDMALEAGNDEEKNKYLKMALNEFSAAAKIYPYYADAYDQLGLTYFRLGDYKNSLANYEQALTLNPGKAISYSNMGVIYFQNKEYDKALDVYNKAIELDPRYADAYYNRGSVYGTLGEFALAVENFKKSLEFNPNNAQAYYFMGLSYQSMGDEKNAQIAFDTAYKLNPSLKQQQ
ncbi:MAG: tetratricopeptide repeat protein, partial [Bacteroidota bacterium]